MCVFIAVRIKRILALAAVVLVPICFFGLRGALSAVTVSQTDGPVLVIDAGHGGEDGGAQTEDGTLESGLNLEIALRLDALAGLCGVRTVLTRTSEDIAYPEDANTTAKRKVAEQHARATLVNALPDAVLISIHQNCFPDSRPFGCQVLYAGTEGSEAFGKLTHELLCAAICPDNRRVAAPAPDSIYLMRSVSCTAILVECGFLSNAKEAGQLKTEAYQIKISAALLASYLQYRARPDGMIG
jgi:N-acetylmuramoyl-L-alanine amidase